jgi:hypothetical protein
VPTGLILSQHLKWSGASGESAYEQPAWTSENTRQIDTKLTFLYKGMLFFMAAPCLVIDAEYFL